MNFLWLNSRVEKIQVQIFENLWELFALQFERFTIIRWFRIGVFFFL